MSPSAARDVDELARWRKSTLVALLDVRVVLFMTNAVELPRDQGALLDGLASELLEDRGFVQELGMPEGEFVSDSGRGTYGTHGPFLVSVHEMGAPGRHSVVSAAQAELHHEDVFRVVRELVGRKDREGNELLLISAGAPDQQGYLCPPDAVMFQITAQADAQQRVLQEQPKYLRAVLLALWDQPMVSELYREADAQIPWTALPKLSGSQR